MTHIRVPRGVLNAALEESGVVSDDVYWKYDDGHGSTCFAFLTDDGIATVAKFFAVLGGIAEVDEAIDIEQVMELAESVGHIKQGRRNGYCIFDMGVI